MKSPKIMSTIREEMVWASTIGGFFHKGIIRSGEMFITCWPLDTRNGGRE